MNLAQLNIAKAKAPMDSSLMKEFVDNLDPINAIAESSDGFIWRLKDETGNATEIQLAGQPDQIVNMSVWDSIESLRHFMFKTHHLDFLKRKEKWFHETVNQTYVLWWIPVTHIPTLEEAYERLKFLRRNGETPYAFSFRSRYQANDLSTFKLEAIQ